jgi:hypothetical protein
MNSRTFIKLVCALAFSVVMTGTAQAGDLQAGAARVTITPTADEFPFQAGRELPYVGVHDDLYARSLVVDDGSGHRVAIVVVEATTVPNAKTAVESIAKEAGIPEANVLLSATHTHNSLIVSYHGGEPGAVHQKEMERIAGAIVEATRQAVKNLQPAHIAFGRGEAYVNINNGEAIYGEASMRGWSDPKGFSDKTLDVVRVTGVTGDPIAALLNYATHAEVMFRSATKEGGYEVSGDLPGAVSHLLEGSKNGAPVVLFTSGAEGDQLPLFKSLQPGGNLDNSDEGAGGWALLDVQARRLANSVLEIVKTMPAGSSSGTVAAVTGTVTCPGKRREMPPEPRSDAPIPPVVIPISVFRLNDLTLASVAADLSSSIGMSMKKAAPDPHTTVVTVAAGMVGYVLSDDAYAHPSHGVKGSTLAPGCAENALTQKLVEMEKETK